jgi:hypothetical protein
MKFSFDDAIWWIREYYTEEEIEEMLSNEISTCEFSDIEEGVESGRFESIKEGYEYFGCGEVESSVIYSIINYLETLYELNFNKDNLYRFMCEEFDCLKNG